VTVFLVGGADLPVLAEVIGVKLVTVEAGVGTGAGTEPS